MVLFASLFNSIYNPLALTPLYVSGIYMYWVIFRLTFFPGITILWGHRHSTCPTSKTSQNGNRMGGISKLCNIYIFIFFP